MNVKIENIGMIENAEIELKGLTLIAGNNSTGKSTVGKILYTFFRTAQNLSERVIKTRLHSVQKALRQEFLGQWDHHQPFPLFLIGTEDNDFFSATAKKLIDSYNEKNSIDKNKTKTIIYNDFNSLTEECKSTQKITINDDFINEIVSSLNICSQDIQKKISTIFFNKNFHKQINSQLIDNTEGNIKVTIKGIESSLTFYQNNCLNININTNIFCNALFIDNPLLIDQLNDETSISRKHALYKFFNTENEYNRDNILYSSHLFDSLDSSYNTEDILNQILNEERVAKILYLITSVIPEKLHRDQSTNNKLFATKTINDRKISIDIRNISTGLKAFALLKILIEKGAIKDRDCLILDEPEIHLHPSWQLVYAELIVLLQKEFNLTIVVNTHSHYFVDALDLYSKKYETSDNFNCYLTSINDRGFAEFEEVTENLKYVYRQMSEPFAELNELRCQYNKKEQK